MSCKAPCALELRRKVTHVITADMDGYKEQCRVVTPQMSGGAAAGMAGNILICGVIGAAVGASSGAIYDLTPSRVSFTLQKDEDS
jgi:hypothetical protein